MEITQENEKEFNTLHNIKKLKSLTISGPGISILPDSIGDCKKL